MQRSNTSRSQRITSIIQLVLFGWTVGLAGQSSRQVTLQYEGETTVTLHEPVVLKAILVNESTQRLRVSFGKNYVGAFRMILTRPNGSLAAADPSRPRQADEGSVRGEFILEALQRREEPILLNEWFGFPETGTYHLSIDFRGSILPETGRVALPPRAFVQIDVLPFNERVLRKRCEALLRVWAEAIRVDEWMPAAKALGFIIHPVAVEYLAEALKLRKAESVAIDALARIGNDAAQHALEHAPADLDPIDAANARAALERLRSQRR